MRPASLPACVFVAAALAVASAACSSDSNACSAPALLALCGQPCVADAECGSGTHCEQGACSAECLSTSEEHACGAGQVCSVGGRCLVSGSVDAGGSTGGTDGGEGGATTGAVGCGQVTLSTDPVTPNVVLVIDQSSSMDARFGDSGTRWTVLKDTLLADDGLIAELQDVVRFGVVLYSATNESSDIPAPPPVGECPMLTSVAVADDNLQNIRDTYGPADMIQDTPTGDALQAILDDLIADGTVDPAALDQQGDPTVFILATDGEPDTCEELDPQNGQAEAVAAVERAFSLGVRTYVVAVAEEDELSQDHLTDLANAGLGVTSGMDAPSFRVTDQDGLRQALINIVGGEISCAVPFTSGRVTAADPCVGSVTLNGNPLECNGDDGWSLLDPETLELSGAACDDLKQGGTLAASFDCNSAMVL